MIEPVPGDWQVLSSTHTYEKVEAHTLRYQIPVPKEGAAKLDLPRPAPVLAAYFLGDSGGHRLNR